MTLREKLVSDFDDAQMIAQRVKNRQPLTVNGLSSYLTQQQQTQIYQKVMPSSKRRSF